MEYSRRVKSVAYGLRIRVFRLAVSAGSPPTMRARRRRIPFLYRRLNYMPLMAFRATPLRRYILAPGFGSSHGDLFGHAI
jgi:hypothetical protein